MKATCTVEADATRNAAAHPTSSSSLASPTSFSFRPARTRWTGNPGAGGDAPFGSNGGSGGKAWGPVPATVLSTGLRNTTTTTTTAWSSLPPSVDRALTSSSGDPLRPALREDMERRFGHDFSKVRVHFDAAAERSAQGVNANAYTVGQDIVFGAGQFLPDTPTGRRLLAHELAHVVQQGSGGGAPPGPAQERDAEAASDAVGRGAKPRVRTSSGIGFAAQPKQWRRPGDELANPLELDPANRGLKLVTFAEVEAKVARVLNSPGFSVTQGRKDFNANPANAKASLYHTHFRDEHERLSYALGVFRQFLSVDGTPADPNELFTMLVNFQVQMEMQSADAVIHTPPTKAENQRLVQLRAQARERELAAEEARTLEQVRLIVEDYYTRGERLKPSTDATLLTIEEAAAAEKRGRTAPPFTLDVHAPMGFSFTPATFRRGQKKGRFTVVVPDQGILKVLDRYYYSVSHDTMFDRIYGVGAYAEQVWENTKHINVAYGHLVKGIGHLASLGNNPLGQLMGPMMETAGEGMLYEVRKIEARLAGDEFTEQSPEIGWRTVVQGLSNVAGGKFGGLSGKVVRKFAPRAAPIVELAVGVETSTVITKGYEAAAGNIEWGDVFRPDVSPVEMLVGLVEGAVLHKFSARWTKGRAPKVPKPERTSPVPTMPTRTTGKGEPEPAGEPASKAKAKAGGDGESAKVPEPGRTATAEQARTEEAVHSAAERAGSEVKMGGEKHGVAAYGKGNFGGFQLCSGQCGLLAEKLAELERILPTDSELAHDVRFLKNKAAGYDRAYRKGQLDAPTVEQAARDLAAELRKNVVKDPFVERLLDMSVEDLRKNRATLKKQAAASPTLNDTPAARDARANASAMDKANAERNRARLRARVDPRTNREVDAAKLELDVGEQRARDIASGKRDFEMDRRLTNDVDEALAVGGYRHDGKPISRAEAMRRALDPHNRQFLDSVTNRISKHRGESARDVERAKVKLKPVSVEKNPSAIFTRRFDEVVELNAVFDEALERAGDVRRMAPGKAKAAINREMRAIIAEGKTPAGRKVRAALSSMGLEWVDGVGIVPVRPAGHRTAH